MGLCFVISYTGGTQATAALLIRKPRSSMRQVDLPGFAIPREADVEGSTFVDYTERI